MPLNYRYASAELASIAEDCTARFVLVDHAGENRAAMLPEMGVPLVSLDTLHPHRRGASSAIERPFFDPDAPIVIAYTNGFTARPKGVVFTHRTVLAYAFEAISIIRNWVSGPNRLKRRRCSRVEERCN